MLCFDEERRSSASERESRVAQGFGCAGAPRPEAKLTSPVHTGLTPPLLAQVTITLLKNAMIQSKGSFFLIDGFPRALDQAESFESSIMPCKACLFFECPEAEMEKRLLKRGETSGRADDNAETIRKRFSTFVSQSLPVKGRFEPLGKCFSISAVPPPLEVFVEVQKAINKTLGIAEKQAPPPAEVSACASQLLLICLHRKSTLTQIDP